jgi:hypothetical protein
MGGLCLKTKKTYIYICIYHFFLKKHNNHKITRVHHYTIEIIIPTSIVQTENKINVESSKGDSLVAELC